MMPDADDRQRADSSRDDGYAAELESATRGLLALNVVVLEQGEKGIGLGPLRGLQALQRLGPSLVTELGQDLDLAPSSASRLSDRLAEAGLITRAVAPYNRRATVLNLTPAGQAVLDDLVYHRVELFQAVADDMSPGDREALLRGAAAFTEVHHRLTERTGTSTSEDSR